MGGPGGRREILAAGGDDTEEPGRAGCVHRLCGWAEGPAAGDRDSVPESAGAVMHRAPGAELPELRLLEGTQGSGGGSEAYLSGSDERGWVAAVGSLRGE